jgi:hypothetical protein
MKPARNSRYLAWIRTQPCLVCGSTRWIEAAHTGSHGLGQKSPDTSAVPLCVAHHRTGKDSYHRLGPRKFGDIHNLDLAAIVRRLNLKPIVRIENGEFVAHLEGCQYRLGKAEGGILLALRSLRRVCETDRLALEVAKEGKLLEMESLLPRWVVTTADALKESCEF